MLLPVFCQLWPWGKEASTEHQDKPCHFSFHWHTQPQSTVSLFSHLTVELCMLSHPICCSSVAQSCLTLCDPMDYSLPGSSVHGIFQARVLEWVAIAFSVFPSIQVFSNDSVLCIRWPKYWSFSSSISPSNEYSGLISFRMDWSDLRAVQGTLKSLLQHHSSKA